MAMMSRIQKLVLDGGCSKLIRPHVLQLRYARTEAGHPPHNRRRSKYAPSNLLNKADAGKSEWWVVDGEMHEIGENVPPRERFVIPRENLPNKRRKQLREQFMRRTRLVLKESVSSARFPLEHEPWCKKYIELYNELRENWERLYWDEGYSKKLAQDHANYDSAEDDDADFNPYRRRQNRPEQFQDQGMGRNREGETWQNANQFRGDTWQKASQIRDKFEHDRGQRMREKAFAPMNGGNDFGMDDFSSRNQPFNPQRYISESESD
ncbi:OLC1v1006624C1 [Oldenlandia corymbosa var. corymbosa]|uniref:OLC1v1006624C1 n=1 Tax=Oldenlandia corymbosa var. corymbosa TaxID=529605 RepID=A0AAV1DHJ1_OLDCO|nr:OLC1v1006624C1 [Oldenlandia corymbosa var. corymbosa]